MKTFILIADGSRASLLFRSTKEPQLRQMECWDNAGGRTPDHLSETDRLGSSGGHGNHSSSMTPTTDPKRHSQHLFAKKLAGVLKQRLTGYDQLVVSASPKLLGDLRKEYDAEVSKKIVAELGKDLTQVPIHDLGPHLDHILGKDHSARP